MKLAERVQRILDEAIGRDLTSFERHQFLPNVKMLSKLSDKQEKILTEIEIRLFGDDD